MRFDPRTDRRTREVEAVTVGPAHAARGRVASIAALLVVVVAGLASRRFPILAPWFGKYPGDALWAAMIFCGGCLLFPRASTARIALFALVVCVGIELLKEVQWPWLVAWRRTTLGGLVFGHVFSVANLVAYAVGIAAAAAVDVVRTRRDRPA